MLREAFMLHVPAHGARNSGRGRRHTVRALRLLQSGEAMAKGDQRVARSRVSDKGRKKGKSSAVFVCAAPDCCRTMSGAFFNSQLSVVTKEKMAHALTRRP